MLAYMLFAQRTRHSASIPQADSQSSTPQAEVCSTSITNSTKAGHLSAFSVPEPSNLQDGLHSSSTAASMPQPETPNSTIHSSQTSADIINSRTDATEMAEPDAVAGPDRTEATDMAEADALAEPDTSEKLMRTPATLSAQHGQNVALLGSLTCNELDASRRSRLQSVLDAYLPVPLKSKVRYCLSHVTAPLCTEMHICCMHASGFGYSDAFLFLLDLDFGSC